MPTFFGMISEKEDRKRHDHGDLNQHIGILGPNLYRQASDNGGAQGIGNGIEAQNRGTALFYIYFMFFQLSAARRVTFFKRLNFSGCGAQEHGLQYRAQG